MKKYIEELKKTVRRNGFQESHGSTTVVIDVETVIDLLDELKQVKLGVPFVSLGEQSKETVCPRCKSKWVYYWVNTKEFECDDCDEKWQTLK